MARCQSSIYSQEALFLPTVLVRLIKLTHSDHLMSLHPKCNQGHIYCFVNCDNVISQMSCYFSDVAIVSKLENGVKNKQCSTGLCAN